MIALDTNILVYAHRKEVPEYLVASSFVSGLAMGRAAWAIPWPCVYEFFTTVTNQRFLRDRASTPDQAWAQLEMWFASPSMHLIGETPNFAETLGGLVRRSRVRGEMVNDARIAAICLAHGVEALYTRDRHFAHFPEVRVVNPFRGEG